MPHLYVGVKMYRFTAYFTCQFRGEKGKKLYFSFYRFPSKEGENKHRCFKIFQGAN